MYKRSIILLQDKNLSHIIRTVMEGHGKEYEKQLLCLFDFDSLRNTVKNSSSTSEFRKNLGEFITNCGYPFIIITDYRMDLGLPQEHDNDKLTFFRSLLISFSFLALKENFKNKIVNILLLVKEEDITGIEQSIKEPVLFFKSIKNNDERTYNIIKPFVEDSEYCKKIFNIYMLEYPSVSGVHDFMRRFEEIIKTVERNIIAYNNKDSLVSEKDKFFTKSNNLPASAILRPNKDKIIINGEIRNLNESESNRFVERVLYLEGSLTSEVLNSVFKNIEKTLENIGKIRPLRKGEQIIIHISDSSVIDDTFATKMGIYISNTIGRQYNILMEIEDKNLEKIKNSPAFIAIKGLINNNRLSA